MLGEDISRVVCSGNMVELQDLGSDRLPSAVIGEGVVPFHDLGVRDGCGVDDCFVVSEHHGWGVDGYPKVSEGVA